MRLKTTLIALTALFCTAAAADPIGALPEDDVLGYLEQLVQWQRSAATLEPSDKTSTREVIFQDTVNQGAISALRSGFKFARLEADLIQSASTPTAEEATPRQRMQQRITTVEAQIDQLRTKLKAHNLPPAQRQSLEGGLKLALAKQELFTTVLANMSAASASEAKGLSGKITNLSREIPVLTDDGKTAATKATLAPSADGKKADDDDSEPSGTILSLSTDVFGIIRKQREVANFADQTKDLQDRSGELFKTLRTELDSITGTDNKTPIDQQVASFKQLGAIIIPLSDTMRAIRNSAATLNDWEDALNQRLHTTLIQLSIKLVILAALVAIPLILGECVRRMIGRYITDTKRKRWANTARRTLVSMAVVFILLMNFVSDFGSFATFAGFLTAGLAVALQGVLMSLVAHFFFYGRYGVRAGDRINVSGVTGEILQIGMTRFYIRELEINGEGQWQENGRIVAFPNSILFQPTGFYKYVEHF